MPVAAAGERVRLPMSIELDATPGDERIFAVFCDNAYDVSALRDQLSRGNERFYDDCAVERFVLHKRQPSRERHGR